MSKPLIDDTYDPELHGDHQAPPADRGLALAVSLVGALVIVMALVWVVS